MGNPYFYAENLLRKYGVEEMIEAVCSLSNDKYIIDSCGYEND